MVDRIYPGASDLASKLASIADVSGEAIVREWLDDAGPYVNGSGVDFSNKDIVRGMVYAIATSEGLGIYLPEVHRKRELAGAVRKARAEYESTGNPERTRSFEIGLKLVEMYSEQRDYGRFLAENAEKFYGIDVTGKEGGERLSDLRAKKLFRLHQQIERDYLMEWGRGTVSPTDDVYVGALRSLYRRKERELEQLLNDRENDGKETSALLPLLDYVRMLSARMWSAIDDNYDKDDEHQFLLDAGERLEGLAREIYAALEWPLQRAQKRIAALVRQGRRKEAEELRQRLRREGSELVRQLSGIAVDADAASLQQPESNA